MQVVRAIIETSGGDGTTVKLDIETQYRRGIVWWKETRVAEWISVDMKMKLLPSGTQFQVAFDRLMNSQ